MPPYLDDLTVFIISTGEDTTAESEEALTKQGCTFTVKHIKDTYPMSSAFQRMPDECDTKYFVQVDSDMILKPHAVMTLYEGIKNSSFMTYMVFGQLYEEGVGDSGAVKCWKHWLFNYLSFRDFRTVDRDVYRRTRWLCLQYKDLRQTLGLHHARETAFTKYLKTKSDIEKRRYLKITPKKHDMKLLNDSIENLPDTGNELFGALLGVLTAKERLVRSKHFELENERYRELKKFFGINGNSVEIDSVDVDMNYLEELFYKSYKNNTDDYTDRTKLALAEITIKLFGRNPEADSLELMNILAR
jgi:hypothetical protein